MKKKMKKKSRAWENFSHMRWIYNQTIITLGNVSAHEAWRVASLHLPSKHDCKHRSSSLMVINYDLIYFAYIFLNISIITGCDVI